MAHALQVETLQNLQCLDRDRALAPGPTGVNVNALVATHRRRLQLGLETSQVVHGEQTALAPAEIHHLLSDVSAVEKLSCRQDGFLAALCCMVPLNLD